MGMLCLLDCGEVDTKPRAQYGGCNFNFRQFGANHFVLLACDYQFENILDAAEWESAVASDDAHLSPKGIFIMGEPTSTSFVVSGCGEESQGVLEYPFTYETYDTDPDLADYEYFIDLFRNVQNYKIIPLDCNGIFNVTPEYAAATASPPATVTDQSPGYDFSLTKAPVWIQGEGRNGKWSMAGKIITNQPFPGVYLPGVPEVLQ